MSGANNRVPDNFFAFTRLQGLLALRGPLKNNQVEVMLDRASSFVDERLIKESILAFSGQSVIITFRGGIKGSVPNYISLNANLGVQKRRSVIVGSQGISGVNFDIGRPLRKTIFDGLVKNFPELVSARFEKVIKILKSKTARDLIMRYGDNSVDIQTIDICPNCFSAAKSELTVGEGNAIVGFLCNEHSVYRRCNECELVYLAHQVIHDDDLKIFYRDDVYKRNQSDKEHLDRWRNLSEKTTSHYSNYLHAFPLIDKNSDVLDIGAGNGDFLALLKNKFSNISVFGVDWHIPPQLKRAFNEIEVESFDCPINKNLPSLFKDKKFHLITLWEVIEHLKIATLKSLLRSLHLLMKDDAYLVLSTPDFDDLHSQSLDFWAMAPGEHLSVFNIQSLSYILEECGFYIYSMHKESVTIKAANRWYSYGMQTNTTIAGRATSGVVEQMLSIDEIREVYKKYCRENKIGSELILVLKSIRS